MSLAKVALMQAPVASLDVSIATSRTLIRIVELFEYSWFGSLKLFQSFASKV